MVRCTISGAPVDHEGEVSESFAIKTGDKKAVLLLTKKLTKRHGCVEKITTDGLRSYTAAMKKLGVEDRQKVGRYANNWAENSHQPFGRRERAMLHFRQTKMLQKFRYAHAVSHSDFDQERHLVSRTQYKRRI